jgi:hypothetical protein
MPVLPALTQSFWAYATQVQVATLGLGTPDLEQVWCTYHAGTAPSPPRLDVPWPFYKYPCSVLLLRIPNPAKDKIITGSLPRVWKSVAVTGVEPGLS